MPRTQPLYNKVALVTGGSHNETAVIAKDLAKNGALVMISYGSDNTQAAQIVSEIAAAGGIANAFKADEHDSAQISALVRHVIAQFGTIDILVNSAGAQMTGINDNDIGDVDVNAAVDFLTYADSGFIMGPSSTFNNNLTV